MLCCFGVLTRCLCFLQVIHTLVSGMKYKFSFVGKQTAIVFNAA